MCTMACVYLKLFTWFMGLRRTTRKCEYLVGYIMTFPFDRKLFIRGWFHHNVSEVTGFPVVIIEQKEVTLRISTMDVVHLFI